MSRRGLYALLIVLGLIILGILFIVFRQPAEGARPDLGCAMVNRSGNVMGLPDSFCPSGSAMAQRGLACNFFSPQTETIDLGAYKGESFTYDMVCSDPDTPSRVDYHLYFGSQPPR